MVAWIQKYAPALIGIGIGVAMFQVKTDVLFYLLKYLFKFVRIIILPFLTMCQHSAVTQQRIRSVFTTFSLSRGPRVR